MQKIILDTNVVISALISNSIPTQILYELVFTQQVIVCISAPILTEYKAVLNRDKFAKFANFKQKADFLILQIQDLSHNFQPNKAVDLLKDSSDNKFLELAAICQADFLITGNYLDFTLSEFENTKIVSPRDYWDKFKPS